MKKIFIFLSVILIIVSSSSIESHNITAIFIDIEAVFQTDSMRASSYIGKMDSLRYLNNVGRLPKQEDLFRQLKPIKAQSSQITYNKNLELPLILSDWLTALQSSNKLKQIIQKFFNTKSISDIEKKVLFAIVNMMMTPQHLADTQKVSVKTEKTLEKIKNNGFKLYLVGNWAHISSLKSEFNYLFKLFTGVYVSGDLHLLKPYQEFYQTVLAHAGVNTENALWIEIESKFISKVKQYGYNVVACDNHQDHLLQALRQYGIAI